MTKVSTACPFSSRPCRECPIYLGRHSQICRAARFNGRTVPKISYGCKNLKLEFPNDLLDSKTRPKDLEDREENLKEVKIVWTK